MPTPTGATRSWSRLLLSEAQRHGGRADQFLAGELGEKEKDWQGLLGSMHYLTEWKRQRAAEKEAKKEAKGRFPFGMVGGAGGGAILGGLVGGPLGALVGAGAGAGIGGGVQQAIEGDTTAGARSFQSGLSQLGNAPIWETPWYTPPATGASPAGVGAASPFQAFPSPYPSVESGMSAMR